MSSWRHDLAALGGALGAAASDVDGRPAPTLPWGEQHGLDGRPLLPGLGEQDEIVRDVMAARLLRRDPGFDPETLRRAAADALLATYGAWSDLDPQRSRRVLATPLWASHRARLELYALDERRNLLDGLRVRAAEVVGVECGEVPDRVTVRITAESGDADVDAAGRVLRGDRTPFLWRQDWTLQRQSGAATPAGGGTAAARCPGCGAPLDLDAEGLCTWCRAPVMDGTLDWVVVGAERTDAERRRMEALLGVARTETVDDEGRFTAVTTVSPVTVTPGDGAPAAPQHDAAALALLTGLDPDLDAEALCRHAATAFVALRHSWARMSADPVRPFMDEPTVTAFAAALAAEAAAGHGHRADDPVIDAVRIAAAEDSGGRVSVAVEVSASLRDAVVDAAGRCLAGGDDLIEATCRLTLARAAGARSPGPRVELLRCPRCGAPIPAGALRRCDFCRAAAAAGGGDWVLVGAGPLVPAATSPVRCSVAPGTPAR